MKPTFTTIMLLLLLFSGCKKPKPVVFSGQLLLTKKKPVPVTNRKIEIFQLGGNAIIMGSSGASASTVTDNNGRFSIRFIPGSSYFAGFSGENSSPLTLIGTEGKPYFTRRNFPDSGSDPSKPIFIGKLIDTLIFKVTCFKAIIPSDTFSLKATTIDSFFDKKYTGITAGVATTFTLDTIYNALFTTYDGRSKTFVNFDLSFGRLITYPGATSPNFIGDSMYWLSLPPEDETKREIIFNLYN